MPILFMCPVCNEKMPRELQVIIPHTEEHIVNEIKKKHHRWIEKDGVCKKCYEYYKDQLHPR
jgi:uncharacterized protein with PIN domain